MAKWSACPLIANSGLSAMPKEVEHWSLTTLREKLVKIGTMEMPVSQLYTQLMVSPVNASRQPSRTAAHHSGPERLARPYTNGSNY